MNTPLDPTRRESDLAPRRMPLARSRVVLTTAACPELRALFSGTSEQRELRCVDTRPALREALEDRAWDVLLLDAESGLIDWQAALAMAHHYWPNMPVVICSAKSLGQLLRNDARVVQVGTWSAALEAIDGLDRTPLVAPVQYEQGEGSSEPQELNEARRVASESVRLHDLANSIPECLWLYDIAQRAVVYVNPAYAQITGYAAKDHQSSAAGLFHCVHMDDVVRFAEAQARAPFGGLDEELRIRRANGETGWVHVRTYPIRSEDGLIAGVGGVMRDISAVVEQQVELYQVTHFDGLTALPNRMLFQERLGAALGLARRNEWQLALLFIDIDRFKVINDTLGHSIGDELLRHAALRLRACMRDSDIIGRLGGDEFAVVLPDMESSDVAAVVARKIVEVMAQPFTVAGQDLFVSASVGVALYPEDAEDIDVLVRNADSAMYLAKEGGRNNYAFYTAEMNARARRRLGLETDLRQALAREEFELYYQPKVSCRDGTMSGVEALIRWRHPDRGLVGPVEFIPLLEETGLIVPVGEWVLRTACAQMKAWHDEGFRHLDVAVNVSARQLDKQKLIGSVRAALADSGLPASALELEVTESLLMRDPFAVADTLTELKQMGIQIAVDDFGTGYSSLSYLKRFPLDNLKVDRAFVQDIAANAGDASITRAVIHMGHELALKVVAEGVETAEQLDALLAAGCDEIQGYFFSKPLPVTELRALLEEGRRLPTSLADRPDELSADARVASVMADNASLRRELNAMQIDNDRLQSSTAAGRALWRETVDNIPNPVLGIDAGGHVVFQNTAGNVLFAAHGIVIGGDLRGALPKLTALFTVDGQIGMPSSDETISCRIGQMLYRVHATSLDTVAAAGGLLLFFFPLGSTD